MKRRTLLSGAIGTILGFATSARAAFAPIKTKTRPDETTDPLDAIRMVYNQFPSVKDVEEIEFQEQYLTASSFSSIKCKRIDHPDDAHDTCDTWLILIDSEMDNPDYLSKQAGLRFVRVLSKQVHEVARSNNPYLEEYNPETELKKNSHWYSGGFTVSVSVKGGSSTTPLRTVVETHGLSCLRFKTEDCGFRKNPEMIALSQFFALITK